MPASGPAAWATLCAVTIGASTSQIFQQVLFNDMRNPIFHRLGSMLLERRNVACQWCHSRLWRDRKLKRGGTPINVAWKQRGAWEGRVVG